MTKTLIPSKDSDFANYVANLAAKLAPMVATFGLTAADATAVTTDATGMQAAVIDQIAKVGAAKSSTEAKTILRKAVEKRVRSLIGRLKSHPAYTSALGEQLGIVAPGAEAAPLRAMAEATKDCQPVLSGVLGADGSVGVKFTKKGFTGVMLYSRRTGENEFVGLGKQLRSPLVDQRPNLTAGQPETREYRAVYLENDQPVGRPSAILIVTVPAQLPNALTVAGPATVLAKAA